MKKEIIGYLNHRMSLIEITGYKTPLKKVLLYAIKRVKSTDHILIFLIQALKNKEEQLRYVISMIVQRVVKQFFQDWTYRINQKKGQFYIFNMTMIQKQTKKHFMVVLQ